MLVRLALLLALSACAPTFSRGALPPTIERTGPIAFHVLLQARQTPMEDPRLVIATNPRELAALWAELGMLGAAPAVDLLRFVVFSFRVETEGCPVELHRLDLRDDGYVVPHVALLTSLCGDVGGAVRFVIEVPRAALPKRGVGLALRDGPRRSRRFRRPIPVLPAVANAMDTLARPPRPNEDLGSYPLPEPGHGALVRLVDDSLVWIVRLLNGEVNVVSAWALRPLTPRPPWEENLAGLAYFSDWDVESQRFFSWLSVYDARGVSLSDRDLPNLARFSCAPTGDGAALRVTGRAHLPHSNDVLARVGMLYGKRELRGPEPLDLFPEPTLTLRDALSLPEGTVVKLGAVDLVQAGIDPTVRICEGPAEIDDRRAPCPSDAPPVLDMQVIQPTPNPGSPQESVPSLGADPRIYAVVRGPLIARRAGAGFVEVRFLKRMPEGRLWDVSLKRH